MTTNASTATPTTIGINGKSPPLPWQRCDDKAPCSACADHSFSIAYCTLALKSVLAAPPVTFNTMSPLLRSAGVTVTVSNSQSSPPQQDLPLE